MADNARRAAAAANAAFYDLKAGQKRGRLPVYIRHPRLRNLYGTQVTAVYLHAAAQSAIPGVLDLGAGQGSATLPFLELGAHVTAVDVSAGQLAALEAKCGRYSRKLSVRCEDVSDAIALLRLADRRFDVVVANSFLHHVPDYLGLVREAAGIVTERGQFFSFQDPLKYSSVGSFTRVLGSLAYLPRRVAKGDVIGGIRRRLRRWRGTYPDECPADTVEYHAVRGGVDQEAIRRLLRELGFECRLLRYFSAAGSAWQALGTALGAENTFGLIARRFDSNTSGGPPWP